MQVTVYCKNGLQGEHLFFVNVNGKDYFLFQQSFKKSNGEFFQGGVSIDQINNYSASKSTTVRKTLDKLPSYIKYVEKEYGVSLYNKTKQKQLRHKKTYKREFFSRQTYRDLLVFSEEYACI